MIIETAPPVKETASRERQFILNSIAVILDSVSLLISRFQIEFGESITWFLGGEGLVHGCQGEQGCPLVD